MAEIIKKTGKEKVKKTGKEKVKKKATPKNDVTRKH